MNKKNNYIYEDLIKSGQGKLFGETHAKLPSPPLLMFDRIISISEEGGNYDKGLVVAEMDIKPNLWFFDCHFHGDPVMPGCLGLDAMWQLLGFYLSWTGELGKGRALGVGDVKFMGQVLPETQSITYRINIKRIIFKKLVIGFADGSMLIDDKEIYTAKDLRVGLFKL